jgi:hypothetical protein
MSEAMMVIEAHSPLPCRASPPQGGRLIAAMPAVPDLPPCGGDVGEADRGGYPPPLTEESLQ